MKKKRKASALITVIVVIMVLTVVGTAMISLTASGYKARIGESNRLENLYGSESGLDLSYNIIANVLEVAISEGEQAVKDSTTVDKTKYEEYNKVFKSKVYEYVNDNLKNNIENGIWIDLTVKEGEAGREKCVKVDNEKGKFKIEALVENDDSTEKNLDKSTVYYEKLNVKLTSTFECTSKSGISNNVPRVLEARYVITIPDYLNIKYKTIYNKSYKKYNQAIAVDGDMNLENEVTISGDVYARGNEKNNYTGVENKYNGGIILGKNSNVRITKGDIVTPRTLQFDSGAVLNSDKSLEVDKDGKNEVKYGEIYAGNVNFGKKKSNDSSVSKGTLNAKSLWIRNDLAINSTDVNVNIDNYYGISDYYNANNTENNSKEVVSKEDISSCILINEDNSNINVKDEAYIWGTAFVNGYATGESLSVKGNYKAYGYPLPVEDPKYRYDGTMQLIYKIDGKDVDIFSKEEYLDQYDKLSSEEKSDLNKNPGTITLPAEKTYSVASYITSDGENGKLVKGKSLEEIAKLQEDVNDMQEKYAEKVYGMGSYEWKLSENKRTVFANGEIKKSVASKDTGLVDFSSIKKNVNETVDVSTTSGKIKANVVVNKENKTVVIIGDGGNKEDYKDENNYITVEGNDIKGVIITSGDVIVTGEVTFEGVILGKGNFRTLNDDKKKIFKAGGTLVEKIIDNTSVEKDIIDIPDVEMEQETIESERIDANKPYKIKDAIDKKIWRVIK